MMNSFFLRPVMAGLISVSLMACGGGGGGSDTPSMTPTPPVVPTPGPDASAEDLLAAWAPTTPPAYTPLNLIPAKGRADYEGYVFGDLSNSRDKITDNVIGSLTLEIDFNTKGARFSGNARDFKDENEDAMTGRLTISGGNLDRDGSPANDATVRGVNLEGTLTDSADRKLAFGFQLEGDFLGGNYNAIGGDALGRVTVDGADQDFDGGFIAQR